MTRFGAPGDEETAWLARHLLSVPRGRLLELGGGGLALRALWDVDDLLVSVVSDSEQTLFDVEQRAAEGGYVSRLSTQRAPLVPIPEAAGVFDLALWWGDLPSMPSGLLREMVRVLRAGGTAWLGGGRAGARGEADRLIAEAGLCDVARSVEDGGLWIEVRLSPSAKLGGLQTGGAP